MPHMLAVSAGKIGNPVAVAVLVKADYLLIGHLQCFSSRRKCGRATPSVLR